MYNDSIKILINNCVHLLTYVKGDTADETNKKQSKYSVERVLNNWLWKRRCLQNSCDVVLKFSNHFVVYELNNIIWN